MNIRQILQETIREEGPVSFERFMDLVLYHSEMGYYNTDNNPIGSDGDYYTVPHVTPVFGAMISRQLKEIWEKLGQPEKYTVVEIGAGNGHLCRSILQYAECESDFLSAMEFIIVEQSVSMCRRAKQIVPESVQFYQSVEDLPEFSGSVLSNELFDNIPFSIVVRKEELMEVYVDHDIDFFEILKPASEKVKTFVEHVAPELPDNFRMEISPQAADCLRKIACKLIKGFVLTIDYGFSTDELLDENKRNGSLHCYHRHHTHNNPYINIGEQDITCHVNFSALNHYGKINGLELAGYVCQSNFLRPLGILPFLSDQDPSPDNNRQAHLKFVSELLFGKTGQLFKVLIQYKGVPRTNLTGLAFREMVSL